MTTPPFQQLKKQNSITQTATTYQNKKYSENATKMKQHQHLNHAQTMINSPLTNSPISNNINNNHHPIIPNGQILSKTKDTYTHLSNSKYSSKKSSFNLQSSLSTQQQPSNYSKSKIVNIPNQEKTSSNNPKSPSSTFSFTFATKFKEEEITKDNNIVIPQQEHQLELQELQENTSIIKEENEQGSLEEGDKKLKETIQLYSNVIRKNEGAGINTLLKVRSVLLNWLKDSDPDIEYNKFMTEKKIKYLLKNKDKSEARIKFLEQELVSITEKKKEVEKILGDMYVNYEEDELKGDIARFENSHEIKSGKCSKTLEKLEEMKQMIPSVIEINKLKDSETSKLNEKKELEKIQRGSNQTLICLTNYYKNLKKKINNEINGSV